MNTSNDFDYFADELAYMFSLTDDVLNSVVDLFNSKGSNVTIQEFSDVCKSNTLGLEEGCFVALTVVVHAFKNNRQKWDSSLKTSNLADRVKDKIVQVIGKLDDNGINGINRRFHCDMANIEYPTITIKNHDVSLSEIHDSSGKLVCHLPRIRMQFAFDEDGKETTRQAYFTKEDLQIFLDSVKSVYKSSNESIYRFKNNDDSIQVVDAT